MKRTMSKLRVTDQPSGDRGLHHLYAPHPDRGVHHLYPGTRIAVELAPPASSRKSISRTAAS